MKELVIEKQEVTLPLSQGSPPGSIMKPRTPKGTEAAGMGRPLGTVSDTRDFSHTLSECPS